jgi:hypothetical protein
MSRPRAIKSFVVSRFARTQHGSLTLLQVQGTFKQRRQQLQQVLLL